eukprot:7066576-Prymnesium_polylepis.1
MCGARPRDRARAATPPPGRGGHHLRKLSTGAMACSTEGHEVTHCWQSASSCSHAFVFTPPADHVNAVLHSSRAVITDGYSYMYM